MDPLTRTQQIVLWLAAAAIGLALAAILRASWLGSVALVAAVGLALGFGFAAGLRLRRRPGRDAD